jgi:hypothetical protein
MEPRRAMAKKAIQAAFDAYRAARRSQASNAVADDVALAKFRAYFPLATLSEVRGKLREHVAAETISRQRRMNGSRAGNELHGMY